MTRTHITEGLRTWRDEGNKNTFAICQLMNTTVL